MDQGGATQAGNLEHRLTYDDLRDWIAEAERLGELRHVTGAFDLDAVEGAALTAVIARLRLIVSRTVALRTG